MRYVLFLFFCVVLGSCNNTPKHKLYEETTMMDSISVTADMYLTKLTELKKFNGVVLLQKDGKEVLRKAYNISGDTTLPLFVKEESQFDLRSVAKLIAKISVIDLEADGKLHREETIDTYFPNFPNGDKITIAHLMHNRSGLPRELGNLDKNPVDLSKDEIIELAAKESLEFAPGSDERYSNIGFQLLYFIIGNVHESSFSEYIFDAYFEPLGMQHSGNNFDENLQNRKQYAFGHYVTDEKEVVCVCTIPADDMQVGNLFSTVDDLQKFLAQLDAEKYEALLKNGKIAHAGGTQGKRAYVERDFEEKYTIVFLANFDEIPFQKLVSDLQDMLSGKTVDMPKAVQRKAISVSNTILQQYEGTYDFADAGHLQLTLQLENDHLYVYQNGKNNGVLYAESDTVFFGDATSEASFEFVAENDGTFSVLMDFKGAQWKGIRVE